MHLSDSVLCIFFLQENGKALQVLRYENEDSKKNFNYFGNSSLMQQNKHLVATAVFYLSNVTRGGQILFPESEVRGKLSSNMEQLYSSQLGKVDNSKNMKLAMLLTLKHISKLLFHISATLTTLATLLTLFMFKLCYSRNWDSFSQNQYI